LEPGEVGRTAKKRKKIKIKKARVPGERRRPSTPPNRVPHRKSLVLWTQRAWERKNGEFKKLGGQEKRGRKKNEHKGGRKGSITCQGSESCIGVNERRQTREGLNHE